MSIVFTTKDNTRKPDRETKELYQFLLEHKQYLMTTLKVVSQHKDVIKQKNSLDRLVKSVVISEKRYSNDAPETTQFIDKLFQFYSSTAALDQRRGDIVELICRNLILCEKCKDKDMWKIIVEAQVLKNNILVSPKDIDIVFEHCMYDMLECKADLESYLKEPLSQKKKDKLTFMENVNKMIANSNIYFVTARSQIARAQAILDNNHYTRFKILSARDIVSNLENIS